MDKAHLSSSKCTGLACVWFCLQLQEHLASGGDWLQSVTQTVTSGICLATCLSLTGCIAACCLLLSCQRAVAGKDLSLHALYCQVTGLGGVIAVTADNKWPVSSGLKAAAGVSNIQVRHLQQLLISYTDAHTHRLCVENRNCSSSNMQSSCQCRPSSISVPDGQHWCSSCDTLTHQAAPTEFMLRSLLQAGSVSCSAALAADALLHSLQSTYTG
jgi:hypothetical protein